MHCECLSMQDNFHYNSIPNHCMDKIKERLKQYISENGGNAAEIARRMKVEPSSLGSLMSKDDQRLSAKYIVAFAEAGMPVEWLLTGKKRDDDRLAELESELEAANRLINSLERILKGNR